MTSASQPAPAPRVTVIITVFRRNDFLEEALRSVLGQTFADLELIVSDDAAREENRALCARFAGDPRLRYRANPQTLGVALNFQAALREARGAYVAFLNDDDLLCPRMLELLVPPLDADPRVTLCFGNHDVIDEKGALREEDTRLLMRRKGRFRLAPGIVENAFEFAVRHNVMIAMGCLFRRTAFEPDWLAPGAGTAYDYWMPVKLGRQGPFFFVPEPVMAWRRHANALTTASAPSRFSGGIFICESILAEPLPPPLRRYVETRLGGFLLRRGMNHLQNGWDTAEGRRALRRSWRLWWNIPAFRGWLISFLPAPWRRRLASKFSGRLPAMWYHAVSKEKEKA